MNKIASELKKTSEQLTVHASRLRVAIREKTAAVEALMRQREDIAYAPLAKEDLIAKLYDWLDYQQDQVANNLRRHLKDLARPAVELNVQHTLPFMRTNEYVRMSEVSWLPFIGLLAPSLKECVRELVDGIHDYPKNAIPMDEREARIAELDTQIDALDDEIAELRKIARQAGIEAS